jgi:dienelactone hydrolase
MKTIETKEIIYKVDGTVCRGFIAFDSAQKQPKPCILIAHDWSGRSKAFCEKAIQLAHQGYVGFAIDMYGEAKTADTTEAKKALLAPLVEHRKIVTQRMLASYAAALTLPQVDHDKIAAMGYCFGGLCVLDLARAGADVKGVISFHGILSAPESSTCEKIRAKILVLHGYDDPLVPPTMVNQFANEMTTKKADWQIHMYGHTQHAFTNSDAHDDEMGLHYNAKADKRSWKSTELFLEEIF